PAGLLAGRRTGVAGTGLPGVAAAPRQERHGDRGEDGEDGGEGGEGEDGTKGAAPPACVVAHGLVPSVGPALFPARTSWSRRPGTGPGARRDAHASRPLPGGTRS